MFGDGCAGCGNPAVRPMLPAERTGAPFIRFCPLCDLPRGTPPPSLQLADTLARHRSA